ALNVPLNNGQVLPTNPVRIRILPANQPVPAPQNPQSNVQPGAPQSAPQQQPPSNSPLPADQLASTRLKVGKTELYVGEVFDANIELRFRGGQDVQLPNLRCEGFTLLGRMLNYNQARENTD